MAKLEIDQNNDHLKVLVMSLEIPRIEKIALYSSEIHKNECGGIRGRER